LCFYNVLFCFILSFILYFYSIIENITFMLEARSNNYDTFFRNLSTFLQDRRFWCCWSVETYYLLILFIKYKIISITVFRFIYTYFYFKKTKTILNIKKKTILNLWEKTFMTIFLIWVYSQIQHSKSSMIIFILCPSRGPYPERPTRLILTQMADVADTASRKSMTWKSMMLSIWKYVYSSASDHHDHLHHGD